MSTPTGKILNVYQNSLGNCRYTFKAGKDAVFIGGEFMTDIKSEIEELDAEVAAGHPHIFINPDRVTIDTTYVDPLAEIKRRAIEEYLASQAAAINKDNDMGNTDQSGKLEGIANSRTVADGMAGSTSIDGAPALTGGEVAIGSDATAPATLSFDAPISVPSARIITAGPKSK